MSEFEEENEYRPSRAVLDNAKKSAVFCWPGSNQPGSAKHCGANYVCRRQAPTGSLNEPLGGME